MLDFLFENGYMAVVVDVVEGVEEPFYESLGLVRNEGMIPFLLDRRPYNS